MKTLDVLVILDRSGSMQSAKSDHEGGLRSFVDEQRQLDGDVRLTLVQFDSVDPCEVVYRRARLDDVKEITLVPRGGTPLLDAMGRALDLLSSAQPEEVICMVITDGEENASSEWTTDRVKNRVGDLEKQGWTFLYLGANVDAFAEAGGIGIPATGAMAYWVGESTIKAAYGAVTSNTRAYRASRTSGIAATVARSSLNFSNEQRVASAGSAAVESTGGQTRSWPGTAVATDQTTVDEEEK